MLQPADFDGAPESGFGVSAQVVTDRGGTVAAIRCCPEIPVWEEGLPGIESKCLSKGVKLTDQRRIIAKVMSESTDHPDVDELYNRVSKIDSKISIATVYRTVKLFEESGILTKHEFKGGKARYEELNEGHHDHLIDVKSGEIIEFVDEEIEKLQKKVAEKYGYTLVDHKLELYGVKKKSKK